MLQNVQVGCRRRPLKQYHIHQVEKYDLFPRGKHLSGAGSLHTLVGSKAGDYDHVYPQQTV